MSAPGSFFSAPGLKLKCFDLCLPQGLPQDFIEFQLRFDFMDFLQIGPGFGVFGHKDRTAVFVGFDRGVVGANAPGFVDDFILVVTG